MDEAVAPIADDLNIDPSLRTVQGQPTLPATAPPVLVDAPARTTSGGLVPRGDYEAYLLAIKRKDRLVHACADAGIRHAKRANLDRLRAALLDHWYTSNGPVVIHASQSESLPQTPPRTHDPPARLSPPAAIALPVVPQAAPALVDSNPEYNDNTLRRDFYVDCNSAADVFEYDRGADDGDVEDDELEDATLFSLDLDDPDDFAAYQKSMRVDAVRRFESNRRAGGVKTQKSVARSWEAFIAEAMRQRRVSDNIVDEHSLILFINATADRPKRNTKGEDIPGTHVGASQIKKEFFGALRIRKVQDAADPSLAARRPAATVYVYDLVKARMNEALIRARLGLVPNEDAPDIVANTFLASVTEAQLRDIGLGFLQHRELHSAINGHLAWTLQNASGSPFLFLSVYCISAMGVDGLWEIAKDAMKCESLMKLTLREGIGKPNRREPYHIGVDASIWFRQSQSVFQYAHAQAGENPELRTLFYRLCRLFEIPADIVFVFDGPGRPSTKRGTAVKTAEHWMTNSFKDLVEAFGFSWRVAPGEAEAELAFLNRIGLIDAVMTDDSDVLVFGAKMVIRTPSIKTDKDVVQVLLPERRASVYMTQGSMLLIALLSGGNYDKGLTGCGFKIAHSLSRYGLGESLLSIMAMPSQSERTEGLESWRERLRVCLQHDPEGHLGRRYPNLAAKVQDDTPNAAALQYYVHPLCSREDAGTLQMSLRTARSCDAFDLAQLAQVCERLFTWGTTEGIEAKFRRRIWKGAVVRLLLARQRGEALCAKHQTLITNLHIETTRTRQGCEERKVKIPISELRAEALSTLHHSRRAPANHNEGSSMPKDTIFGWLPAVLLDPMPADVHDATPSLSGERARKRHLDESRGMIDLTIEEQTFDIHHQHNARTSVSVAATRRRKVARAHSSDVIDLTGGDSD